MTEEKYVQKSRWEIVAQTRVVVVEREPEHLLGLPLFTYYYLSLFPHCATWGVERQTVLYLPKMATPESPEPDVNQVCVVLRTGLSSEPQQICKVNL